MNTSGLVALGAIAGLVAGVAGTTLWLANSHPQIATVPQPTFRSGILSVGGDKLDDCKAFDAKYHPDQIITIHIPAPFDINNLNPTIKQMGVVQQAPWTNPDLATASTPAPPTWTPRTPLDLNLGLTSAPSGKKYDKELIQVIVDDPSVTFRTDGYAVEATGKDGNGKKMLCQLPNGSGYTPNSAMFLASYYTDGNGSKPTFGSYNLGLIMGNGMPYYVPIFIDPEIENNG